MIVRKKSSNSFIPPHPLKTAVLFLIFNRPDTTKQVFEAIRKAKPPRLYVAADGPRTDKSGEAEKCEKVRRIATQVDWDCEVKTLFREKNLGCKVAVSSGINWFFEHVEEGIVLEDDTLPDHSFFGFCHELLEKYRDDERIGMVSGNNFQSGRKRTTYSYHFSRYGMIWGWASWRRAWEKYCVNMKLWPEIRDGEWLQDILGDKNAANYWARIFENVYQKKIDTWDYQWAFTRFVNNYLILRPNENIVANIGFGEDSTHTEGVGRPEYIKTEPMKFPLLHPPYVIPDSVADNFIQSQILSPKPSSKSLLIRSVSKIRRFLTVIYRIYNK